jgi:hypothetical protein
MAGDDNATPVPAYFDPGDDVLVADGTTDDPVVAGDFRMFMRTAQVTGDATFTAYASAQNATDATEMCSDVDNVSIMVLTPPIPDASCDDGKPKGLVFEYTGDDCSATTNDQRGKAKCQDFAPLGPDDVAVRVEYRGKDRKKITVMPNDESVYVVGPAGSNIVTLEATRRKELHSSTKFEIKRGGEKLQKLEIHTSCSKPLNVGDQFGSLILREFIPK